MKKLAAIFILSAVTLIINFWSGFPVDYIKGFNIAASAAIIVLTYLLRREFLILHHTVVSGKDVVTQMYVESIPKKQDAPVVENNTL